AYGLQEARPRAQERKNKDNNRNFKKCYPGGLTSVTQVFGTQSKETLPGKPIVSQQADERDRHDSALFMVSPGIRREEKRD
ncbi:hypothetical protein, partial [Lewinella sp. JB7]|uniref:hypothetical protein n=1 Tax=Lewinella sp. JB7 TaxID=2962887 RepID=UPI0020CA1A19